MQGARDTWLLTAALGMALATGCGRQGRMFLRSHGVIQQGPYFARPSAVVASFFGALDSRNVVLAATLMTPARRGETASASIIKLLPTILCRTRTTVLKAAFGTDEFAGRICCSTRT